MKTIMMLSQKGGSGKTTIAIHLAVAAQNDGNKVLLIDTDPQESAKTWHCARDNKEPRLISIGASRVPEVLEAAKNEAIDYVIIDTIPYSGSITSTLAQYADLLLIPSQPTPLDIAAVASSVKIAKARNKPAIIIVNRAPLRAPEIKETFGVLSKHGISIYPSAITDRRTYFRAITQGLAVTEFEPESVAAQEMTNLYNWIKESNHENAR